VIVQDLSAARCILCQKLPVAMLLTLIPLENRRLLSRSPTGNMVQSLAWSYLNPGYPISNFLGDCLLTRVSGLFRSAAYIEDIEIHQHFRYFNTHSDVFAVHQPQDVSPSFISGKPKLTIVYLLFFFAEPFLHGHPKRLNHPFRCTSP
jgi:hypothetical protein